MFPQIALYLYHDSLSLPLSLCLFPFLSVSVNPMMQFDDADLSVFPFLFVSVSHMMQFDGADLKQVSHAL